MRKNLEERIIEIQDTEPVYRCGQCGKTNYRLPKTKGLLKHECKYCAECDGLMITYNYKATNELGWGIGGLAHLQSNLSEYGIGCLGISIDEIEANLFQKLNNATTAFAKFKSSTFYGDEKETLQDHKIRIQKNRERYLESQIRKSIPNELKKGKTRTEIKKLVEKEKKRLIEQAKIDATPKIVSMKEYQQKKQMGITHSKIILCNVRSETGSFTD